MTKEEWYKSYQTWRAVNRVPDYVGNIFSERFGKIYELTKNTAPIGIFDAVFHTEGWHVYDINENPIMMKYHMGLSKEVCEQKRLRDRGLV